MEANLRSARTVAPGRILKRELEARDWTQRDLAEIMGRPYQVINEIMRGTKQITPDTARELSQAFGTSPEFWMNLEMNYRLHLSKQEQKERDIARRSHLYSLLPVTEIVRRGWIKGSKNIDELEKQICSLLDIVTLQEPPTLTVSLRQSRQRGPESAPVVAWIKRVEHLVQNQQVLEYSRERLKEAIPTILAHSENKEDIATLPQLFLNLGVHFIVVPHLSKTYLDGAAFDLHGHPIIALTLRYDRIDSFWFTLMHELGHIVLRHQRHLDCFDNNGNEDREESEANQWARNHLIDQKILETFINTYQPRFSRSRIVHFAQGQRRHPGIILGQLHKRELVRYKNLRTLLVKVRPYLEEWSDHPDL